NANTPTSGTGKWSAVAGNPSAVVFDDVNNPTTTVRGMAAGTYRFMWTISNGTCSPSSDIVDITVYPPTVAGRLIADSFVCAPVNKGVVRLSGNTGRILRWEMSADGGATWTISNDTSSILTYQNLTATTRYRVLVQSGNCSSAYSNTVTINVNQPTKPGNLYTSNKTVCQTVNSGVLELRGATGGLIRWESSTDKGRSWNVISDTDTAYQYDNLTTSTWFRVLVQNGVCTAAYSDTMMIQVDSSTVAGKLGGDATVCMSNNNGKLVLTGNTGSVIHWESTINKGVTWTVIAQTGTQLSYTNADSTTIYRALVKNGVCATQYSNEIMVITVPPVTPSNAGPGQTLCNAETNTVLNANKPASGAGIWTQLRGPSAAAFTNAASASTRVDGLVPGTYEFAWSIANGVCTASTSTVTVKVEKLRAAFGVKGIYDCGLTTFNFRDSSAAHFNIVKRKWVLNDRDSSFDVNFQALFTQTGTNRVALTVTSEVGCSNTARIEFPVDVFEFPKANIAAMSEACRNQLLELKSDVHSKDSIAYMLWFLGNGTRIADSLVKAQYTKEGEYTVKLLVSTVNRCFDSAYKQLMIHPTPVLSLNKENIVCSGDSAGLGVSGAFNYIWKDQNDNVVCNSCRVFRVKPTENTTYKVIGYTEYGCSDVASTSVRVIKPLSLSGQLQDTICFGNNVQIRVQGAASYLWRNDPGLNNYSIANPVASPKETTTYQVVGKDAYNCFADTTDVRITVGKPTEIKLNKDTAILAGTGIQLRAISSLPNIRTWRWEGADFSCLNCPAPMAKVVMDQTIRVTGTNIYGCTSSDTMRIKTFCPTTEIFIPNAFSPDGDGINDKLVVQGKGVKVIKSFRIYNRWGEMVFEKLNFYPGDANSGWDGTVRGKAATPDVFVYVCEVICERGTPGFFKGNVAVLR
ncbi:T9SS type B sorting domain-containing protein, partial [Sediminibacterium soli]|uniref:T9SS type B sorting domain-containing protein n=1 Tax=Sediminibacterium soli TaxID=2698829 RepID=UPI00137B43D3